MSHAKLLIVDDEESIRNQLTWGLADEYEIVAAASLDEARNMLRMEQPSLVTLDVALQALHRGERGQAVETLDAILWQEATPPALRTRRPATSR